MSEMSVAIDASRGRHKQNASHMRLAPVAARDGAILTLNCGSSSLKFAVFTRQTEPLRILSGSVTNIGADNARSHAIDAAPSCGMKRRHASIIRRRSTAS